MEIKQEILDALSSIDEEITELQIDRNFVENFKIEPIPHEKWHTMCDTPLRNTRIPEEVAKLTFSFGKNFKTSPNYVSFEWNNFLIQIPTSRQYKTEIAWVKWVAAPFWGEDVVGESERFKRIQAYIEAVKNHDSFLKKAKLRYNDCLTPFGKVLKYAANGFWNEKKVVKKVEAEIEEHFTKREASYQNYLTEKENYEKTWFEFFNTVLPVFQEWYGEKDAEKIFKFNGNGSEMYKKYLEERKCL